MNQPSIIPGAAGCWIEGHALVECRLSELPALRGRAAPPGAPPIPPRFLRHADEQTVVGLQAVLEALAAGPPPTDRARHAVVAAACQPGRLAAARTLALLESGGAAAVSPHVVPHCSLHSVAGAVSVALGMHGPHLGVGGGPDALAEGLFAAATLLGQGDPECAATWLVATDWDEEPALDPQGSPQADPVCRGLAVKLVPAREPAPGGERHPGLALAVRPAQRLAAGPRLHEPAGGIVAFARALAMCREGGALVAWTVACPWGGEIRVTSPPPATSRLREAA